ncbi:MAG: hypothetical protein ACYSX0_22205 [Planctomycetota bacterium]|jgi:hypothetical protein
MLNRFVAWCEDEEALVYEWTETAMTECPNDSGHTLTPSSISIEEGRGSVQRNDIRIALGDDPYLETNNSSYEDAALLIFGGENADPPSRYQVVVSADHTNPTADVRVYDITNTQVIAEKTGITFAAADTYYIEDLGDLSNLPTDEAIFVVQIRRASGSGPQSVRISYVTAFY